MFVIGSCFCVANWFYLVFHFLSFTQWFDSDLVNVQPIQKGKITGVSFIAVMEVLRNLN